MHKTDASISPEATSDRSTGSPLNQSRSVGYNYTADWLNRTTVNDNGSVTGYSFTSINQYTAIGGVSATYDQNFNLYTYNGWRYDYDADAHPSLFTNGATTAQFVYDGLGRCVKRTINGVATLLTYDGWKPTMEWKGDGSMSALNVYGAGADEILYRYYATGERYRYHHDIHGNVTFLLDWWGNGLERYTYDAFGKPTITDWNGNVRTQSAYGNRFMFTGREYIAELGIYDYRNRMYMPDVGRFLQADPKSFDAGDFNLFRYCADDPVDKSDPMGLEDVEISRDADFLGALASFNSLNAARHADDRDGRSQVVQQGPAQSGKLSLQAKINLGEVIKTETRREADGSPARTGAATHSHKLEKGVADKEYKAYGKGHVHRDVTANENPNFSIYDRAEAVKQRVVWKVNESNPNQVLRYTPQKNSHDEPTVREVADEIVRKARAAAEEAPGLEQGSPLQPGGPR